MVLAADNARRFAEERDKVKYLKQLDGRNLKERKNADRKWNYHEEDSIIFPWDTLNFFKIGLYNIGLVCEI
jgi:hypothetical protein